MLVTELISMLKRRASLPDTNSAGSTDTDILEWISSSLDDTVYPIICDMHEEFFLSRLSLPLSIAGAAVYPNYIIPLPSRCFGSGLREIKFRDVGCNVYNIPLLPLEDVEAATLWSLRLGNRIPAAHFMGDSVQLVYTGDVINGWIDMQYVIKTPTLSVSTSLCKDITKISTTGLTTTFTIDAVSVTDLDTYCPVLSSREFDIFRKSSRSYAKINVIMTRTTSATLTCTLTDSSTLLKNEPWLEGFTTKTIGDLANFQKGGFTGTGGAVTSGYLSELVLCPADQNVYIPLPKEAIQLLLSASTSRYLTAIGDTAALNVEEALQATIQKNLIKVFGNRCSGESKVFSNRHGLLKFTSNGRFSSY